MSEPRPVNHVIVIHAETVSEPRPVRHVIVIHAKKKRNPDIVRVVYEKMIRNKYDCNILK